MTASDGENVRSRPSVAASGTEQGPEGKETGQGGRERPTSVLYLDLDGTVRHGCDELGRFVNGPEDIAVFPEAVEMMRRWKAGGGRIVGVSNQGGIALGHLKEADCSAAMMRTHELAGGLFDKIAWCHHHPDAQHLEMARCWCRKPAPGLLIESALDLAARHRGEIYPPYMALMVGDRPEDEECARIAGVDFQWAADWRAQSEVKSRQDYYPVERDGGNWNYGVWRP